MESLSKNPLEIHPYCFNESNTLRIVVIGYPYNFHDNPATVEIINRTQARYYGSEEAPIAARLIKEFGKFQAILETNGVVVLQQKPCPVDAEVPDQLTPRAM